MLTVSVYYNSYWVRKNKLKLHCDPGAFSRAFTDTVGPFIRKTFDIPAYTYNATFYRDAEFREQCESVFYKEYTWRVS